MSERFAGKYQLLRHIASGGMGEVFLASLRRQAGFNKLVVVKRILPAFAKDPEFVDMFVHEARLSAALDHPNIVRVYDFGRAGDSFFLVMEYLHGDTLLALLPRAVASPEGLDLAIALTIVLGVCAGLHFAHEMVGPDGAPLAIVHRDITPANVFVTHAGEVKILDFGIAKAISAGSVTREGVLKGKLAYMSPEQCLGEPLDRRSDVFAVGILLYEMTTMKRLFRGKSDFEVMNMITAGPIPAPSSRALNYPPALEAVVMRALARDPDARYATAQALHDELEHVVVQLGLRPSAAELGRFVRRLTNDKRYPSLEPESASDDAPTQNFFASLNEVVTIGDVSLEPDAAPMREPADEPPPVRRRKWPALVGGGLLVAAAGALWIGRARPDAAPPSPAPQPSSPAAPAPMPAPTPAVAVAESTAPAAVPEPPPPEPKKRKKRTTKRRTR